MSNYADTVRASLSTEDTEHLLNKAKFGGLTDEAHAVALEVLKSRGVDISSLPSVPVSELSSAPKYWELDADEKRYRRYRMYAIASTFLLPLWSLGGPALAMDLAHGKGIVGVALGWLVLLILLTPSLLSAKALWATVKSEDAKDIQKFIGRFFYGFWGISIASSFLWLVFGLYGVIVEAKKYSAVVG